MHAGGLHPCITACCQQTCVHHGPKPKPPQLYFCGVAITDSVCLTQCMDDTPLKPPCTRRALLAQANTPWLQQPVDSCIVREHDTAALHDAAHGRGHAMGQVCVHALAVRLEMSSLVGSRYSSSADGFIACIHSTHCVLHRESHKGLESPRKAETKLQKAQLQST